MAWITGVGTLLLALATATLALQSYRTRVDSTQPTPSVSLLRPGATPLLPPEAMGQRPAPATSHRIFKDADASSTLLLIRASGVIVNGGELTCRAGLRRSDHMNDPRWREFEIVEWGDQRSAYDELGWLQDQIGTGMNTKLSIGSLSKVGPLPIGEQSYLILPKSISRVCVTLGASVEHWGGPFRVEPTPAPATVPAVSCQLRIDSPSGRGAFDLLTLTLKAAPVSRAGSGEAWWVQRPDVVEISRSVHIPPVATSEIGRMRRCYRDPIGRLFHI